MGALIENVFGNRFIDQATQGDDRDCGSGTVKAIKKLVGARSIGKNEINHDDLPAEFGNGRKPFLEACLPGEIAVRKGCCGHGPLNKSSIIVAVFNEKQPEMPFRDGIWTRY